MKKIKLSVHQTKVAEVMHEFNEGGLHSGISDVIVTNPKQAIAIALSEAEGLDKTAKKWKIMATRKKPSVKSIDKSANNPCWKGYKQIGMKEKNGKQVPNCVPDKKPSK